VREWEAKLTPALAENLRRKRKGRVGPSWYVDGTYIRVRRQWRYLYRAIDRDGALVDVMLSEHRDMTAAKAFFRSTRTVTGVTPDRVTKDGHDAYPRAIRTGLGRQVRHRTSRYLNNRVEQDHRGIKGRCRPMLGLKSTVSATRYCRCHEELRNFLRCRSRMRQRIPATTRRWQHIAQDGDSAAPIGDRLSPATTGQKSRMMSGAKSDRTCHHLKQDHRGWRSAGHRFIGHCYAPCPVVF
jgi:transposase-like protein